MENVNKLTMDDFAFYRLKDTYVELCLNLKGSWDTVFVAVRVPTGKTYYLNSKDTKLEVIENEVDVSNMEHPNKSLFASAIAMHKDEFVFREVKNKKSCTLYREIKNKFNFTDSLSDEKSEK